MSTLIVCTIGGHLQEALSLAPRLEGIDEEPLWVTWKNEQSASLLAGKNVVWVDPIEPRDYKAVVKEAFNARRLLAEHKVTKVVSTGAAISLSYLPVAALAGIQSHYIECFTRSDGPSVTGKILEYVPKATLYTQYPSLTNRRWIYRGSLLDGFRKVERRNAPKEIGKVVVTLGTMPFSFRRLLEHLIKVIPPSAEVLWQTGHTDTTGLEIDARKWVPGQELADATSEADVVIGHCGTGTTLTSVESGTYSILVPREFAFDENVDDHQLPLAEEVNSRDVALGKRVEEITEETLWAAANHCVERSDEMPAFKLD